MAKKPAAGAPAWMATFADLMSLLLVLFVLLLTFAEMDVVKYKAIAGSVKAAFGFAKDDQLAGVIEMDGSLLGKAIKNPSPDTPRVITELPPVQTPQVDIEKNDTGQERAEKLENTIETVLQRMGLTEEIGIERKGDEVVVRFPDDIAFPSGSSQINEEFGAILDRVLPVINQTDGTVIVAGHTDNIPLSPSSRFQSNWDLSASRATSVLHWMINENHMDPNRLILQGFGDSRPIADNGTPEGRAKNRRVELTIILEDQQGGAKPGTGGSGSSTPAGPSGSGSTPGQQGSTATPQEDSGRVGTGFIRQSRP
ncbi:OmpA family protein [Thalassospira marina]|uniref:Cell envelope biogenesis protein OmpA n=1 Tax=Thalassospira marina TaxID=2048283 RepID=A0A2N3KBR4_9PROT|nr:OmpA family protein [Thalassospira marina]PKR47985.1 cell envelope biogenesis protein OmpA [Thalassospira marina]